MTRLSSYFLPTEKHPPADAEAISHKLMVRAGLVRQIGAGLWSYLPAGWRVHTKVVEIIREEIDAIGGQEMLMPVLHPAEVWKKTGRYEIDELFKLQDRKGAEMVLAMTHEEIVTTHVAQVVRSYRDLPLLLYHFQVKERDEPRPRAGVLRTREFIMKDSYTFDRDLEGLNKQYDRHIEAYDHIFERCGLQWYRVESDVGMMGGVGAHEYMAPCAAGENEVALAPGYAANLEIASADAKQVELLPALDKPEEVSTPGLTTVTEVCESLGVAPGALLKAFPIMVEDRGLVLVVIRGDHRLNEIKLQNALGADFRLAKEEEFSDRIGPAGFIGPVSVDVTVLLDEAVAPGSYVCGANRVDAHLRGIEPGRDFSFQPVDVRTVEAGDTISGNEVTIEPAIEVGNIFKLGTRYSEPLGAKYLDDQGNEQFIWMGSYGIGPARIVAAAVEQYADDDGISWPRAISPFDVHLVVLGKTNSEEFELADKLYAALENVGLDVLYDDRDAGPGEKFADAELLGCPLRVTVGKRTLKSKELEVQVRRGREVHSIPLGDEATAAAEIDLETVARKVAELWQSLP